ncbi:hypothetical protein BDF14DRAFT_1732807 [Spinellus fusiger]|nr:hypothetical protein BDF14DRAFT_1732807 [Spinellus fusiger]
MAARRCDCILMVDEEERLSGILTTKDIAYRAVGEDRDFRTLLVSEIATKNPMCVTSDTCAQDALQLMATRGFRHLPVCNENGDVFGLLDITQCLQEVRDKLGRIYGSLSQLATCLENVEREWPHSSVLTHSMESIKDKMTCPNLATLSPYAMPVQVSVKTHVDTVAKLMKEYQTTAVLVMDARGLAGIITSKDIVLRVVAAGLIPADCSVVRVMTPHPDTVPPSTSIVEALDKMHEGLYLNLPILQDKVIVGLVDALRLTCASLEQLHAMEGANEGKFWANGDPHDNGSALSEVLSPTAHSPSTPVPSVMEALEHSSYTMGYSDCHGENKSSRHSDLMSVSHQSTFSFKFEYSDKMYRFRSTSHLSSVHHHILRKISHQAPATVDWISVSYMDDEDDEVLMTHDSDLEEAIAMAEKQGLDRVRLVVHDSRQQKSFPPATAKEGLFGVFSFTGLWREKSVQEMMVPAAMTVLGCALLSVFSTKRGFY